VTLAGLKKLVKHGFIKRSDSVVLILTGHMLKDPDFTIKFHRGDLFPHMHDEAAILKEQQRAPIVLDANVEAVLKVLEQA
jgi:threonine synthase